MRYQSQSKQNTSINKRHKNEKIILNKSTENIKYKNEIVFISNYKNYYNENYYNFRVDWEHKKYYYKNITKISDYLFV